MDRTIDTNLRSMAAVPQSSVWSSTRQLEMDAAEREGEAKRRKMDRWVFEFLSILIALTGRLKLSWMKRVVSRCCGGEHGLRNVGEIESHCTN
jgi:hypothetical protein